MIRDPSDGSVHDKPNADLGIPISKAVPTKEQAQSAARLDRSKQWLADYHARKGYPQISEESAPSGLPD